MEGERRFHWADYLVFCTSLAISAVIGIYYAFKSRRQTSTAEYLIGGRDMGVIPVAASLVVSLLSAIFVQGVPVETYAYGMYYCFVVIGYAMALIVSSLFYHPVYHRLGITSVYEYLEMRYCKEVRIVCSVVTMFQMVCYSSVALYAPSIAISQATGLPYWSCILLSAALCTFYTTLGGFKTVLWTDTLQCGIMVIGLTATLIKASMDVGGISQAFAVAADGERMSLVNIIPHPLNRHTIWNWIIGDFPFCMAMYAAGQFAVQRFCSVKSINKARLAMICAIPIYGILVALATILGLVAFAYYQGCDPYITGRIRSRDQTLALLVMDVFKHQPGMAGVFLSSILSAALSTLSSVQNSFAAILLEDFLKPLKLKITRRPLSERQATVMSKITVFLVGATIMCLSIGVSRSGKLILQLGSATLALGSAPVLGVFTLGLFVPFANSKGSIAGIIIGIVMLGWVVLGALSIPKTLHLPLPLNADLCALPNSTATTPEQDLYFTASTIIYGLVNLTESRNSHSTEEIASFGISRLYRVSYKWYCVIGFFPTVLVGAIVSLLTGGWDARKSVGSDLLFSFRKHGLHCCHERTKENEMTIKNIVDGPEQERMLQI